MWCIFTQYDDPQEAQTLFVKDAKDFVYSTTYIFKSVIVLMLNLEIQVIAFIPRPPLAISDRI
jgi:hypothetical protein